MIGFENVSKFVVSNVTLHIPEGKTVGLIGDSGAGKTTLIKLACCLLTSPFCKKKIPWQRVLKY